MSRTNESQGVAVDQNRRLLAKWRWRLNLNGRRGKDTGFNSTAGNAPASMTMFLGWLLEMWSDESTWWRSARIATAGRRGRKNRATEVGMLEWKNYVRPGDFSPWASEGCQYALRCFWTMLVTFLACSPMLTAQLIEAEVEQLASVFRVPAPSPPREVWTDTHNTFQIMSSLFLPVRGQGDSRSLWGHCFKSTA